MRRNWLSFLMVAGLLLARNADARTASARPQHRPSLAANRPAHLQAHRRAHATLLRARRMRVHLATARPVATALIDPVPRGRFAFPAPLKGSHDSLLRQNSRSRQDGLARVQGEADLLKLIDARQLVAIPATPELLVDERLPANRRYCRPWAAQFLSDVSRVHYGRFHHALQVNSAIRTIEYQRHLELVNGNAAPAEGEDASPHLTGATIDLAKKGLSMSEVGWMRAYLMPLQAAGKIDVEEEFSQSCFHITVYKSYRPAASLVDAVMASKVAKPLGRSAQGQSAALLAARLR